MKNITILGSTGTIGVNTLNVIKRNRKKFSLFALSADRNVDLLLKQVEEFNPVFVVINDAHSYEKLKNKLRDSKTKLLKGEEGIKTIVESEDVDIVVSAISGTAGVYPTYRAVKAGKFIALANKESLVSAGDVIIKEAKRSKANIIPVDSEHSAIFQLLQGKKDKDIKKIILPASGGPFLDKPLNDFSKIKIADALNHPVWNMGKKITIDSATLANKGLEVIEAHYLFNLPFDKIEVFIHRQCIVHGMVEMIDGTIISHLGKPDMKLPISYALLYPKRDHHYEGLSINDLSKLTFEPVSDKKFPFLKLAYDVGIRKKSYPAVFNSADDRAVSYFLKGVISFKEIYEVVNEAINEHKPFNINTIEEVMMAEKIGNQLVDKIVKRKKSI